ncbi:hypothetical protein AMTR_s00071p00128350 [Amborella trichopoda]|uniref:COMM domain-containing protein n=1 Tax=Amborella trichopoda TaxID=13333 RepID=U5D2W7_AMBTC|nr:hypothetical protein AMTR_s00071p00128350 [Amborella trichopoda]
MNENGSRAIPAHELLDFDWKLKCAVSSSSMDMISKPLLRLELFVSKEPGMLKEHKGTTEADRETDALLAEYDRDELDKLIAEMEGIEKVLDKAVLNK